MAVSLKMTTVASQTDASPRDEHRRSRKYCIPHHVYLCQTEDGIVFLDLRKDKYLGLGGDAVASLADVVDGWPVSSCGHSGQEWLATAEELARRGLLTTDSTRGKSAAPIKVAQIEMAHSVSCSCRRPRIEPIHVTKFLLSCLQAAYQLRCRSLEAIADGIAKRKAHKDAGSLEIRRAFELALAFRRLRSFLFTEKDNCLFSALALLHFLAKHSMYPTWIIGVRTGPFGAHSWIQLGSLVLDGDPKEVSYYTPLLAI
jgi:hypothetical protein